MSLITIITTTYKHQDFIAQTIESILSQTHTERELLIGDDSPDDATRNIIQTYVSQYPGKIKAWHHDPNKGIVDNMRFLINQISKETTHIAFLEGDDLYTPDNLAKKIEIFIKYPKVKLVYSDFSFINAEGETILKSVHNARKIPNYQGVALTPDHYISHGFGPIISRSNGMIHRSMIDRYSINNPTLHKNYIYSDYDFYLHIAQDHQIRCITEILMLYRRHQTNASGPTQSFDRILDLVDLIQRYVDQKLISKKIYNHKLASLYGFFTLMALEKGNKCQAWNFWGKTWKLDITTALPLKIAALLFFLLPTKRSQQIIHMLAKR